MPTKKFRNNTPQPSDDGSAASYQSIHKYPNNHSILPINARNQDSDCESNNSEKSIRPNGVGEVTFQGLKYLMRIDQKTGNITMERHEDNTTEDHERRNKHI